MRFGIIAAALALAGCAGGYDRYEPPIRTASVIAAFSDLTSRTDDVRS
jgi:hypothetical protein